MDKIKRIPYGKSDFEAVNGENRYYVDKTHFIPVLEKTDYVFLIRPRRFGKSLFLSTLHSYYDIKKKGRFEEFYRETYILKHPTEERGKYMVLYFNFSEIIKDRNKVQEDFNDYCKNVIEQFVYDYEEYLPKKLIEKLAEDNSAHKKLQILSTGLKNNEVKIYLMIDEYDNFTNTLLSEYGESEYKKIAREAGYFKDFFTILKGIATGSGAGLARMFITGVSPVTMDDVTSGFNIGDNISVDEQFNEILGFTEKDVNEIIDYYSSVGLFKLDKEETLEIMKKWYGNYRFSEDAEKMIFNTDSILHFMNKERNKKRIISNLIDPNMQMDYGKLRHLIAIDGKLNGNFTKLKTIINDGGISSEIVLSFPYDKLIKEENFISLLYFFGLITFTGKYKKGMPYFEIPNETIRKMMFGYIRDSFNDVGAFGVDVYELKRRFQAMAYDGDFKPVFRFIADEIKRQTKIRDFIEGEKVIQGFFMAYLNVIDFYISLSEEEMSKGYADIVMKPFYFKYNDLKYAYLLEFKYIKRTKDKKLFEEKLAQKISESKKQLDSYADDDFGKKMMHTPPYGDVILKKGIIIFHGWELVYIEENE